jgi:PhnB protein
MAERSHGVIPHLIVEDAASALKFYKKGLGATETMRMPADDGKRILHAEIEVNGARVFVMDDFPEHSKGKRSTPAALSGTPVMLHLEVRNCDAAVKRAVAAGAKVTLPPMDAFWGARYGQVVDPFGHSWSFAHPLKKKSK